MARFPFGNFSLFPFVNDKRLTFDELLDGVMVRHEFLVAGDAGVIRSQNYDPDLSIGWAIFGDGSAVFNNITSRGSVYATTGTIGGWEIGATSLTGGDTSLPGSVKIAATADDSLYWTNGGFYTTAYLSWGNFGGNARHSALRFILNVPQGATITSASIKFRATGAALPANTLGRIQAVLEPNHAAPTTGAEFEADVGMLTTAYVDWTVDSWTVETDKSSPDIAAVLQEIVDQPTFVQGNAIGVQVRDNGSASGAYTRVYDYSGSATYCAELIYTYEVPSVSLESGGVLSLGTGDDVVVLSAADAAYRLWAGAPAAASASFRVTKDGAMTALSGVLGSLSVSGTLTLAGTGKIVTDDSTPYVELSSADAGSLLFHGVVVASPGYVRADLSFPGLLIRSPEGVGKTKYAEIQLLTQSTGTNGSVLLIGDVLRIRGGDSANQVSLLGALTKVTLSAAVAIADSTYTNVSFDTEDRDTEGWHESVTNPTRLTFDGPAGTTVHAKAIACFASNATGRRHLRILKNGTSIGETNRTAVNGAVTRMALAVDDYLDPTDYVEMQVWQDSGGNLNLVAGVANTHLSLTAQ